MMTRLRAGLFVAGFLCLSPSVSGAQAAPGLTLGAAAAALRDSVPVFEDAAFRRLAFPLRLGDAAPYRGRSDSIVTVSTPRGGTGYVRLRDIGLIGLPSVREGEVIEFSRRFQPYVLWYLARRFTGTRVADQWGVPPDRTVGRRLYSRLVHEFPADSLVPAGLKVPDMHVRFGAVEGNLRQAEMDLADRDTASAVAHLRDIVDHYPTLARVSSLDALFLSMIGDLETRSAATLGPAAKAHGVQSLFRVLREFPRDVVRGLSASRVPAFEAAEVLLDERRFTQREVIAHAVQIVRIDSLPATRMVAWVAQGRRELAAGRAARADSLGVLAARAEPQWFGAARGQGPPLEGNPRPAMRLLSDAWRARGGRLDGLRSLRRLAADSTLGAPLRGLAQQELAACLDHGPGSVDEIRALGLAAVDQGWRARLEAGGWLARVATAGPPPVLRAGDWDSSVVVGRLAPGESLQVLAVSATWPAAPGTVGGSPHHRVKVRNSRGVIGWTDGARLGRVAGARGTLLATPVSPALASALALGALPPRARVVVAPPRIGLAPPVTAAGNDLAVTQFAFDTDAAAPAPANPTGLIDGATGHVRWIRPIAGMTLPSTPQVVRAPGEPGRALAILAPGDVGALILEASRGGAIGTLPYERTLAAATPPALVTSGDVVYTIERTALVATRVRPDSTLLQIWSVPLSEPWTAVPPLAAGGLHAEGLADSLILAGSGGSNPRMRAWSMRDGHPLWTSPAPDGTDLFVAGPGVVLAYAGIEVWAAASATGALLWNRRDAGTGDAYAAMLTRPAAIFPDRVLQLSNQTLLALDPRTGAVLWTAALPQAAVSAPAKVPGDPRRVVVALSQGMLAYFDVADGRLVTLQPLRTWSTDGPTPPPGASSPRWATAYIATTADAIAVSADDGILDVLGPPR